MPHPTAHVQPSLARLRRRLTVGLFLEIWPIWAAAALVLIGTVIVVCRVFVPAAAPVLPWLWLIPAATAIPVFAMCLRRAYQPDQVAAIADSLAGGQGILLTLFETGDPAWAESQLAAGASQFQLPRLQLRPALSVLIPAAMFVVAAMLVPQRIPSQAADGVLAKEVSANLTAAIVELKKQELITPEEEQKLREEVSRIERSAEKRMDASTWEAADALREKMNAGLSDKQSAVKWAQDSAARFSAAMQAGGPGDPKAAASAAELMQALEKLAQSGLLGGASQELKGLLKSGKLPTDAAALAALMASVGGELANANGKLAGLGNATGAFGRFNPEEFATGQSPDGDGAPGRGGVNRGRADAELTWGRETARVDTFKSKPLPPGAPRSPDDWAPVVVLPGAPQESAVPGAQSAGREYAAAAGQGAWRRSLAPRHQTAVKKYFDTTQPKKSGGGR
ncbi:MAG TPA: hypothetical protein VFV78_08575 [Vicinamibacterales bacterium]|nr:hypothetical protein [Vicinamibacterales bacterium]